MIVQVFNSGIVSGPETLVLPSLPLFREPHVAVFLTEKRWGERGLAPLAYARKLGLRAEAVEVSARVDWAAPAKLRTLLRGLAPRVVHAHDVKATTYTWLASRGEPWGLVSTHHGVAGRPDWKTKVYEYFYSQVVLPKMNLALTVSREDEMILRQRAHSPAKVQYVANGITRKLWDENERARERARLRAEWAHEGGEIPEDACVIGMVARLSAEKRHFYFLRVLAEMRAQRPDLRWRFFAVGSGVLAETLRAETLRLGLGPFVRWFGYREDAAALIAGFDVLALSSAAEGLPIVALEAGWARTPLITSNVGGLPELVGTGKTAGGIIFPREQEPAHTAKSLAWLLENPAERSRFGARLQSRVAREYSAQAWVARMESIYRTV